MNTYQLRVVGAGLFYVFIFLSGIWLSRSGRPLNAGIFTVHKLVSLAAVAFLVWTIVQINRAASLPPMGWIAVAVTAVLFLGTVASGALLSFDRPVPAVVLSIHRIAPILTVLSSAATLYVLRA